MNRIDLKNEKAAREELEKHYHNNTFVDFECEYGKLRLTEAVNFLRVDLNGEWLLKKVLKCQELLLLKEHRFQHWEFYQMKNLSWHLYAATANKKLLYSEILLASDFPLRSIQLWKLPAGIILIPQEI